MGLASKAPAKAPACITETMLADRFAPAGVLGRMPNSLEMGVRLEIGKLPLRGAMPLVLGRWLAYSAKAGRVITPPMMPMSMPNSMPPKQACVHIH